MKTTFHFLNDSKLGRKTMWVEKNFKRRKIYEVKNLQTAEVNQNTMINYSLNCV